MIVLFNTTPKNLINLIFLLIVFFVSNVSCSIKVHTINQLGDGKILKVHCYVRKSKDLGEQSITNGSSFEWEFRRNRFHSTLLHCVANLDGAPQLEFDAFDEHRDSCSRDCDWLFSETGVFNLREGRWTFEYSWPPGN